MTTDWTRWALVVAVGLPLLWLLASGAATQAGAWLITALVAAIGIRAVFRSRRFEPERYRERK
jgi:membrane protein implicated in regulation of membrane protease activity